MTTRIDVDKKKLDSSIKDPLGVVEVIIAQLGIGRKRSVAEMK